MMHGHGKMHAAPASDAATCISVLCPIFFFHFPIHADLAPICADSGQISPYRPKPPKHTDSGRTSAEPANLGRNSKKKM